MSRMEPAISTNLLTPTPPPAADVSAALRVIARQPDADYLAAVLGLDQERPGPPPSRRGHALPSRRPLGRNA